MKEYWVVYPGESVMEVFELNDSGTYVPKGKFVREDTVRSNLLKGLEIRLQDVFDE